MNEASTLTPQYAQYTGEPVKVEPVISVSCLCIEYPNERTKIRNIGFSIARGETFGLIGESGSGKTSVCKAILAIIPKGTAENQWKGYRVCHAKSSCGIRSVYENKAPFYGND